jgi:hypothetical protein
MRMIARILAKVFLFFIAIPLYLVSAMASVVIWIFCNFGNFTDTLRDFARHNIWCYEYVSFIDTLKDMCSFRN